MVKQPLDSVKLSKMEDFVTKTRKNLKKSKRLDCDIPLEAVLTAFFPNLLTNIKKEMTAQFIDGYNTRKQEENKENES